MSDIETPNNMLIHWIATKQIMAVEILKYIDYKTAVKLSICSPQILQYIDFIVSCSIPDCNIIDSCGNLSVSERLVLPIINGSTRAEVRLNNHALFQASCVTGYLSASQMLARKYKITAEEAQNAKWVGPIILSLCRRGYLNVLQWLVEYLEYTDIHICDRYRYGLCLVEACRYGNIPTVEWLCTTFSFPFNGESHIIPLLAFNASIDGGHFNIVKWIAKYYNFNKSHIIHYENVSLMTACMRGHLDIAKWITQQFNVSKEDLGVHKCLIFQGACANGHLDVAKWLANNFAMTNDDIRFNNNVALRWAGQYQHTNVVKWLTETFNFTETVIKNDPNTAFLAESQSS